MKRVFVLACAVLVEGLAGCAADEGKATMSVWDSAGVEVVENHQALWGGGTGWSVDTTPALRLGVVGGDRPYEFAGVTGALRLPDGSVVVADGASQEIRYFGSEGEFLRTVGGQGAGPGEFTGLSRIGHGARGRIWAYDILLRRLTWMDSVGNIERVASMASGLAFADVVGVFGDGRVALRELWHSSREGTSAGGGQRELLTYVVTDSLGGGADTLGVFPGKTLVSGCKSCAGGSPFSPNSVAAAWGTQLIVGSQDRYEYQQWSLSGSLERRVSYPGPDLTLRREDAAASIQRHIDDAMPDARLALRAAYDSMPLPETRPAYGPMRVDADGYVWLGEWKMLPDLPRAWAVFDPEGAYLGDVSVPRGFEVWDIGADWMLGLERSELGVERVVMYRLTRSVRPGRSK